jgi:cyanophycinase
MANKKKTAKKSRAKKSQKSSAKKSKKLRVAYPNGVLVSIGGGEDKKDKKSILSRLIEETGKKNPSICIITVATNIPKEVGSEYKSAFKKLGVEKLSFIHFVNRIDADKERNIQKVKQCDVVLLTGGDQLKLTSLLGGTKLITLIKKRYFEEKKFVVAGTSAGAAAMSDTMIIGGSSQDAMIKGELELTNGLDLIDSVFIDTHFIQRGRLGRIVQTVTCNPGVLGLGLGEDTAAVIYKGTEMEVVGSGLVVVVDGISIDYTDLTLISDGDPITVEGIKLHILGPGKRFLLSERRLA